MVVLSFFACMAVAAAGGAQSYVHRHDNIHGYGGGYGGGFGGGGFGGGFGGGIGGGTGGGIGGGFGGAAGGFGAGGGAGGYGGGIGGGYGYGDHYWHYPNYKFDYGVKDFHTGDHKKQWEQRHGDSVKGGYYLYEPDGTKRVVEYVADKHHGFNAIVKKIGFGGAGAGAGFGGGAGGFGGGFGGGYGYGHHHGGYSYNNNNLFL
ncbi:ctenidin-3-like [Phlebotomus papatasi]|uniref:ctenidin-3-like n=1 Tax=Phlebotomus papatasi TaxID=29031 RepID=UPI0024846C98|nr:ctenidin-3-like [Phlebotomus papatasi]